MDLKITSNDKLPVFLRELQMDFFEQSWHWLIFHVGTASIGRSVMKSWDNSQILCL